MAYGTGDQNAWNIRRNKNLQMKNIANDIYDFYIFARVFFKVAMKEKIIKSCHFSIREPMDPP